MAAIKEKALDLRRLRDSPDAILVLRLVMALNDLASGEEFMRRLQRELPETENLERVIEGSKLYDRLKQPALQGYVRYINRMRVGHLAEAKKVVDDIAASADIAKTLNAFRMNHNELWRLLQEAFEDDRFAKHIAAVRGNLGFHYNHENGGKLLQQALDRRIDQARNDRSKVVLSRDQSYMRLQIGDDDYPSVLQPFRHH